MRVKGFGEFLEYLISMGAWFVKTGRKLKRKLNHRIQWLVRFDAMLRFNASCFFASCHHLFLLLIDRLQNPRIKFGLGITTGLLIWFAVIAILKLIFDF
jgi:hypothetical protein